MEIRVKITDEQFEETKPGAAFAKGYIENSPNGMFMTNIDMGRLLMWVAVKGYANDWAMYTHWADEKTQDQVESEGDKVVSDYNIEKVLDISKDLLEKYRY